MPKRGPQGETLARVERVRNLVVAGEKLVWALGEVGLSTTVWYRWSGWKRAGSYRRTVRARREVLDKKEQEVRAYLAEGERLREACNLAKVSEWTMRYRLRGEVGRG